MICPWRMAGPLDGTAESVVIRVRAEHVSTNWQDPPHDFLDL